MSSSQSLQWACMTRICHSVLGPRGAIDGFANYEYAEPLW